jgi:prepilin-type N-terminal cleavage/methylation domain-containing protein
MRRNIGGFTLIEMLVTLAIIGTVAAIAAVAVPNLLSQAKADGAIAQALNTLRVARDRAIGERRNIEVRFIAPNHIQVARQEIVASGPAVTTVVTDTYLESGQKFMLFTSPALGDTPDAFGVSGNPVAFATTPVMFTSEGTLVDSIGDLINGTVFLGKAGDPTSARAISIFGTTALLRTWRWNKTSWVE